MTTRVLIFTPGGTWPNGRTFEPTWHIARAGFFSDTNEIPRLCWVDSEGAMLIECGQELFARVIHEPTDSEIDRYQKLLGLTYEARTLAEEAEQRNKASKRFSEK